MAVIKFPFTSFQQFNLDWIMQKLHEILQFMPENGVAGDVLQRTVDGAAWMPLTAVSLDIHGLTSIPDVDDADELAIYDNSQQGNYKVTVQDLLASVVPPVTSVNGQTGDVVIPIPTKTSDLTNDDGFVDAAGAAAAAPVQSVNGKTGAVVLDASDVGALPDTYVAPVTSVNGLTGNVVVSPTDFRAFTEYYPSTGDVKLFTSDDLTDLTCNMTVAVSDNKKFLRIGGFLSFKTGGTSGWKYIRIGYTENDLYFDFVPPSGTESITYPAIVFDGSNLPVFSPQWNNRVNVNASGSIVVAVYLGSNTAGTVRTVAIPSVLIQTAT